MNLHVQDLIEFCHTWHTGLTINDCAKLICRVPGAVSFYICLIGGTKWNITLSSIQLVSCPASSHYISNATSLTLCASHSKELASSQAMAVVQNGPDHFQKCAIFWRLELNFVEPDSLENKLTGLSEVTWLLKSLLRQMENALWLNAALPSKLYTRPDG